MQRVPPRVQAFHSTFNTDGEYRTIGNVPLLPLKSKIRGPAPPAPDPAADDIVDEAIYYFRPNSLFRNFEIGGGGDRVMIYLLLFIQECLGKLAPGGRVGAAGGSASEGSRVLANHALQNFAIPGDAGFPLNALFERPANKLEADTLRQYLGQLRQETAARLVGRIYDGNTLSKWWMSFSKRRFMAMDKLNDAQRAEIAAFVESEQQRSSFQQQVHAYTDVCWDKCIMPGKVKAALDRADE
ncbi:subunit of the Arp2/3 complex, partial [Cladochytrium tenue]